MKNSNLFWQLLQALTPNGTQTLSKGATRYVEGIYPKLLDRGKDGHVIDVDGNEYIDLISGLGAVSVGYVNSHINREVVKQLAHGVSFSLPSILEYHVAKRLTELVPHTDMWKFTKTGSDAVTMAVKCARAYTKRDNVLVCGYHGWHDWFSIVNDKRAGIPLMNSELVAKAKYNDLSSFAALKHRRYAAVVIEPMVFEYPKEEFFQSLRQLCNETGTLLMCDEVVTGGRFEGFVAQSYFNIKPDLTVLSKGIANGFPLAAVGGNRTIMQTFERNDFFASTTFGGDTIALSASLATLDILVENICDMVQKGKKIQNHFNKEFKEIAVCNGYPTRLSFDFPTQEHRAVFMQEMCLNGVLTGGSNMVMATHSDNDIAYICDAITDVANTMKEHWNDIISILRGLLPVDVFKVRQ